MASSSDRRSASSASSRDRRSASDGGSRRREPSGERGGASGRRQPPKTRVGEEIAARKRAEREARLADQSRGWRVRALVAVVVAVAVLGGGIALYRSSAFSVRKVRVVGASHLKLSHVLAVAAVPADTTLLRLPDDAIRARLLKDPWIAEAEVVKRFPDTVELHLTERRGVALVEAAGAKWLVDTDGWVLEKHSAEATSSLPVVRDIEGLKPAVGKRATVAPLANALAVLRGIGKELRGMVRVVTAPSVDETALLTKEGVEVLIGPATQLDAKDAIARKILAAQRGKVVFIDVRTIERPVSRGLGQ